MPSVALCHSCGHGLALDLEGREYCASCSPLSRRGRSRHYALSECEDCGRRIDHGKKRCWECANKNIDPTTVPEDWGGLTVPDPSDLLPDLEPGAGPPPDPAPATGHALPPPPIPLGRETHEALAWRRPVPRPERVYCLGCVEENFDHPDPNPAAPFNVFVDDFGDEVMMRPVRKSDEILGRICDECGDSLVDEVLNRNLYD